MEKQIDIDSLVKIETLPKVFYQLDQIREVILPKIEELKELECNEDNKKEIKKYRSEVNNLRTMLETKRKDIKKAILEPYDSFEGYYTQNVKTLLDDGLNALDEKIKNVEQQQLEEKSLELYRFFAEWSEYYHITEIVKFENLPIKVNLSTSEKKLKEEIKTFLEKVSFDLECISSEEQRDDILYEYQRNGYDYTKAKLAINEREKKKHDLSVWQDNVAEIEKVEQDVVEVVEEVVKPIVIETQEITIKFNLMREEIKELNDFLKEHNFEYEILD